MVLPIMGPGKGKNGAGDSRRVHAELHFGQCKFETHTKHELAVQVCVRGEEAGQEFSKKVSPAGTAEAVAGYAGESRT